MLLLWPRIWARTSRLVLEEWSGLLTSTSRTLTPPVIITVLTSLSNQIMSVVLLEVRGLVATVNRKCRRCGGSLRRTASAALREDFLATALGGNITTVGDVEDVSE